MLQRRAPPPRRVTLPLMAGGPSFTCLCFMTQTDRDDLELVLSKLLIDLAYFSSPDSIAAATQRGFLTSL